MTSTHPQPDPSTAAMAQSGRSEESGPSGQNDPSSPPPPVAVVCIGMAGSGKTTFMRRINAHLHAQKEPPYVINLDPAVLTVPFESNIDIRDSVNYEEVMRQYNLGPNGGILTSLNLFATRVDQVINLLEKRAKPDPAKPDRKPIKHILIDTPGQIEVFVWSASGTILLESLASSFPTVIAYIIDTPRTTSTSTFMSNMLYACSILYKTRLPMILVFNKTDVRDADFAREWMTNFDAFQEALRRDQGGSEDGGGDGGDGGWQGGAGGSGYMGSLVGSMGLMLEEFYTHLSVVGVSSRLGTGVDEFFTAVRDKADEFTRDYLPELERRRANRDAAREADREKQLDRLMRGMSVGDGGAKAMRGGGIGSDDEAADEGDEDEDEDEDGEDDTDADDMPDADRAGAEGLQARYQRAVDESMGDTLPTDASFANYLHSQRG